MIHTVDLREFENGSVCSAREADGPATGSTISDILKLIDAPDVISFAGGLPSPDTFPTERLRGACERVLTENPTSALQYSNSRGYGPLREWIAQYCARDGSPIDPERVLITAGSQQALDLIGKAMAEPGRTLLVERPTYLGALQAWSLYGPDLQSVESDEDGPMPHSVAAVAHETRPSLLYLTPNYQNPTGRLVSLGRRQALIECARRERFLIIEDDPYRELAHDGTRIPSLLQLDPERVVHIGSFSKILAPGLRLGYVVAPSPLCERLAQVKQAADLHTSTLVQHIAFETIRDDFLEWHLPPIRAHYASQCSAMIEALEQSFPDGCQWTRPRGGLFIWIKVPGRVDTDDLLRRALLERVAFVPGSVFYASAPDHSHLRLSFATATLPAIREGLARLGRIIGGALHEATFAHSQAAF